jgi:TPR repeat protein
VDHPLTAERVRDVKVRFFPLWVVLALALGIFASPARGKGIDPALLSKANAGNAEAQYQLGNAYNYGDKVRQDYAQALIWYRRGAEQGNADSQFQLGGLYHFGHGVPQDDAQGFAWTMKAAEQGHLAAEFFISVSYGEGWGIPKDEAHRFFWLRRAAEDGYAYAQYALGRAYEDGLENVHQDHAKAYFWLDLAASHSDSGKERREALKKRDNAASHLTATELSKVRERVKEWHQEHSTQSE